MSLADAALAVLAAWDGDDPLERQDLSIGVWDAMEDLRRAVRDERAGEPLYNVGFGHLTILSTLRPDVCYPSAPKARRAHHVVTRILAEVCDCPDAHVEVWVKRVVV